MPENHRGAGRPRKIQNVTDSQVTNTSQHKAQEPTEQKTKSNVPRSKRPLLDDGSKEDEQRAKRADTASICEGEVSKDDDSGSDAASRESSPQSDCIQKSSKVKFYLLF